MGSLGGAQIIGGIAVEIYGDTSRLRSADAEAKSIAARIESTTKIAIQVGVSATAGARLTSDVRNAVSSVQQMVNASPIRIPVILDTSRLLPQMGGGSVPMLPGGGGGWTGGPRSSGGSSNFDFEGSVVSSTMNAPPMIGGGGTGGAGYGGGGVGGGGWGGFSSPAWLANARTLLRGSGFGRALAAGLAVREVIGLGNAAGDYQASRNIGDPALSQQYADKYEEDLNSTSLGLRRFFRQSVPNMFGHITAAQRDQAEGNRITSESAREDTAGQQVYQRNMAAVDTARTLKQKRQTFGLTENQTNTFNLREQLGQFDADNIPKGGKGLALGLRQARDELVAGLARSLKEEAAEAASQFRSTGTAAFTSIGNAGAGYIGATQGSVAGERRSLQVSVATANQEAANTVADLQAQGVGPLDPRMIAARMAQGASWASGKIQTATQNFTQARDASNFTANSQGRIDVMNARIGGNNSAAKILEVHNQYEQQIQDAQATDPSRIPQLRREQGRAVEAANADLRRQSGDVARSATANIDVLSARGNNDEQAAQLLQIQNEYADKIRQATRDYGANSDAVQALTNEQVAATAAQKEINARHEQIIGIGLDARTASANARAGYEDKTAGILSMIGSLKSEAVGASPEDRDKTLATELAELKSAKAQLSRPTEYAEQGGRFDVAPGGPGGYSGKDLGDATQALTDAIKAWTAAIQGGGLPN